MWFHLTAQMFTTTTSQSSFSSTMSPAYNHHLLHYITSSSNDFQQNNEYVFNDRMVSSPSPKLLSLNESTLMMLKMMNYYENNAITVPNLDGAFIDGHDFSSHVDIAPYPDSNPTIRLPHMHNVTFLLNVSRDIPEELSIILFGYILPNLFALTIITNLLIVAVLSQSHMRTPTNLVLLGMAIADLLTLLIPSPWYIYLFTFGHHHESIYPVSTCYTFHWMYEVLPALFHTYSIWLTLLLAAQRYIYVCHFSLARRWCTVPQVIKAMLAILTIAILHQSTRFFDRIFRPVKYVLDGKIKQGCEFYTSDWVIDYVGEDLYYIFYYGFRIIFVHTGPCILLVWLNVLLFYALHRTQKTRKRLLTGSSRQINNNNNNSTCTTVAPATLLLATPTHTAQDQRRSSEFAAVNARAAATSTNHVEINKQNVDVMDYDDDDEVHIELEPKRILYEHSNDNNQQLKTKQNEHYEMITINEDDDDYEEEDEINRDRRRSSTSNSQPKVPSKRSGPQQKHRKTSTNVGKKNKQNKQNMVRVNHRLDSRSTTVMLMVIVSMFLFLEIPLALTTILHVIQNTFAVEIVNYSVLNTIIMMTNFFIIVSYPINFAIYCGMSRQFRITFHQSILQPLWKRFHWISGGSARIHNGWKYFRNLNNNKHKHKIPSDTNNNKHGNHKNPMKIMRQDDDNIQMCETNNNVIDGPSAGQTHFVHFNNDDGGGGGTSSGGGAVKVYGNYDIIGEIDLTTTNGNDEANGQQDENTNPITGASITTYGLTTSSNDGGWIFGLDGEFETTTTTTTAMATMSNCGQHNSMEHKPNQSPLNRECLTRKNDNNESIIVDFNGHQNNVSTRNKINNLISMDPQSMTNDGTQASPQKFVLETNL